MYAKIAALFNSQLKMHQPAQPNDWNTLQLQFGNRFCGTRARTGWTMYATVHKLIRSEQFQIRMIVRGFFVSTARIELLAIRIRADDS